MGNLNSELSKLKPTKKLRLMDLVEQTGIDISDWGKYKRGPKWAAANPKYCYEWSFGQNEIIVLNLWFEDIRSTASELFIKLNMRTIAEETPEPGRSRATDMDKFISKAFSSNLLVRIIVASKNTSNPKGGVKFRKLDPIEWAVESYKKNGEAKLVRCSSKRLAVNSDESTDPDAEMFTEGELRKTFIYSRRREQALREEKIEAHASKNDGRLPCEVPGCGFDFKVSYGVLGKGYAQVHHKFPLSGFSSEGREVSIDDLAVVCANCHAMIHRGGKCRELGEVSKSLRINTAT